MSLRPQDWIIVNPTSDIQLTFGNFTELRYPYQTQEAQTRRLADLAFMMCDYRLAANLYEIARKDFLADKAWRYYASATVSRPSSKSSGR